MTSNSTIERALAVTGFDWCDTLTWTSDPDGSLHLFVDADCVGAGQVEFGDEHIDLFETVSELAQQVVGDRYPLWMPDLFAFHLTGLPLTSEFPSFGPAWLDLFSRPAPDTTLRPAYVSVSDTDTLLRAMRATSATTSMFWRHEAGPDSPLQIYVQCSDPFVRGYSDVELVTADNVTVLESTVAEVEAHLGRKPNRTEVDWMLQLFCARARAVRFRGAYTPPSDDLFWAEAFRAAESGKKVRA